MGDLTTRWELLNVPSNHHTGTWQIFAELSIYGRRNYEVPRVELGTFLTKMIGLTLTPHC